MINVGFNNYIDNNKVVAVIRVDSAPARRLIQSAREKGKVIDATMGHKTRAVIVMTSDHFILSSLQTEKITEEVGR